MLWAVKNERPENLKTNRFVWWSLKAAMLWSIRSQFTLISTPIHRF